MWALHALLALCQLAIVAAALQPRGYSHGSVTPVDESIPSLQQSSPFTIAFGSAHSAAAAELRRYLYLLTRCPSKPAVLNGATTCLPKLLELHDNAALTQLQSTLRSTSAMDDSGGLFVLVGADSSPTETIVHSALGESLEGWVPLEADAGEHDHVVHSAGSLTVCHGTTSLATKYAVFSLLEALGVGFRLHGDALPEPRWPSALTALLRQHGRKSWSPGAVDTRGIQPFHDFAEGPDQWNADEYKLHIDQLVKLKMNFIGLHTYPNAEPTVWTGLPDQFDPSTGDVEVGYHTSYQTTAAGGGDKELLPLLTSNYSFGTRLLMAGGPETPECYGPDSHDGHGSCMLEPGAGLRNVSSAEARRRDVALFNSVGRMLRDAFSFARAVGVKTCVGTQDLIQDTLPRTSPARNATSVELYTGVFERIKAAKIPIDYYWLWTGEGFAGRGDASKSISSQPHVANSSSPAVQAWFADALAMDAAHKSTGANFSLATCGWTLGPLSNRSYFDALPPGWTLSSINEKTEREYRDVKHHDKWVIPWLEDDAGLLVTQLWVNRTLNYSLQGIKYGASGLMGIHWRTREVAPQLSALAKLPWNHSLTSLDAWRVFFKAEIGEDVAEQAARIFSEHADSDLMPRPGTWGESGPDDGPGIIRDQCPGASSWEPSLAHYDFVEQFHGLRNRISSRGALERFDLWDAHMQFALHVTLVGCDWRKLEACIDTIPPTNASTAPARRTAAQKCLSQRERLVNSTTQLMNVLLASVASSGTVGTVQNVMQHTFPLMLDLTRTQLETAIGEGLPAPALPTVEFSGRPRLFVPTARLSAERGRRLLIRAVLLSNDLARANVPSLHFRAMGSGTSWTNTSMTPRMTGRGVFVGTIPATIMQTDVEWYVASGQLVWPATAPGVAHTVVVLQFTE